MKNQKEPITKVHFRKSTTSFPGNIVRTEITAVFTPRKAVETGNDIITCYCHVGQHSECSAEWAREQALATPEEYQPLFKELTELCGYRLKVA